MLTDGDVVYLGLVDVAEVEVALRGRTGGCFARWLGWQTEVAEDVCDGLGILDMADTGASSSRSIRRRCRRRKLS
jgi:hypothetical protein